MKKCMLVTLVMAFLMVMASSYGLAQVTGRTDTSKEGSLLIWPKVQTNDGNETYITIINNAPEDVWVKCYWEIKDVLTNQASQCFLSDFVIQLTANMPVVFKASDGSHLGVDGEGVAAGMGSGEKGVLKCWAVDPSSRKQISWNHLSGFGMVVNGATAAPFTSAWEYSAWRFAANVIQSGGGFVDGFWVGQTVGIDDTGTNVMNLKGTPTTIANPANCPGPDFDAPGCNLPNAVYDACPVYLTFDFIAEPNGTLTGQTQYAVNDLSLVPCKEDLTDAALSIPTKLVYTIWNENEVKYTGLYQCANCAYEGYLGNLSVGRAQKTFQAKNLHTSSGRFRVDGVASSKCGPDTKSTPLIGIMSARLVSGNGGASVDRYATNGTGSGAATGDFGYIWWTPGGNYYERVGR